MWNHIHHFHQHYSLYVFKDNQNVDINKEKQK